MLRNYPVKTSFGFLIWFALATLCCAVIGHPIIRIFSYTSLIFFGVIQGWSILETYKQENESNNFNVTTVSLSKEKAKKLKIAVYVFMTFSLGFGCWACYYDKLSLQLILSAFFVAVLFIAFRLDRLKELRTAREIAMGSSFIAFFFVAMLPLSFNVSYPAIIISALGTYIAGIGETEKPQKVVRLSAGDFNLISKNKDFFASSKEEALEMYEIYPYVVTAVKKKRKLAGYASLVPLKNVSQDIEEGKYTRLKLEDIMNISLMKPSEPKSLLLSTVFIFDKYKDSDLKETLLKNALLQYEDVFDCIDSVYIYNQGKITKTDFDSFKNNIL